MSRSCLASTPSTWLIKTFVPSTELASPATQESGLFRIGRAVFRSLFPVLSGDPKVFLTLSDGVFGAAAHQVADLFESLFIAVNQIQGAFAGKSLDASHSGCDAALEMELENSDLSGSVHMGAAAKLGGKIADFDHPHTIAVFIAEKGQRTVADRLIVT